MTTRDCIIATAILAAAITVLICTPMLVDAVGITAYPDPPTTVTITVDVGEWFEPMGYWLDGEWHEGGTITVTVTEDKTIRLVVKNKILKYEKTKTGSVRISLL